MLVEKGNLCCLAIGQTVKGNSVTLELCCIKLGMYFILDGGKFPNLICHKFVQETTEVDIEALELDTEGKVANLVKGVTKVLFFVCREAEDSAT